MTSASAVKELTETMGMWKYKFIQMIFNWYLKRCYEDCKLEKFVP